MINFNISFYLIVFLFFGCGPNGTLSNRSIDKNNSVDSNTTTSKKTSIIIERGPVFMATVIDSSGKKAVNNNFGFSNIYEFDTQPTYPIKVEGGYIDVNRNDKLDNNDTKLDINMSSYSNIISPLTTLISNQPLVVKQLSQYYDINKSQISEMIPSQSSKNAILLSNICYIALKNNYKIGSSEFNETVDRVEILYQKFFTETTDLSQLAFLLEEKILKEEKVEELTDNIVENIENNLSIIQVIGEDNKTQEDIEDTSSPDSEEILDFSKNYSSTDNIQNIWNIILEIPENTNINNFNIAAHIVKDDPQTIGDIFIKGISIENNKITNINSINVFGKKVSGSTGSIGYDSSHIITQNSVAILQDKLLLIKFGYIMEQQSIVSTKSFKRNAKYNITLYLSKININASTIKNDFDLQLDYNTFHTFTKGTQTINGIIKIGE